MDSFQTARHPASPACADCSAPTTPRWQSPATRPGRTARQWPTLCFCVLNRCRAFRFNLGVPDAAPTTSGAAPRRLAPKLRISVTTWQHAAVSAARAPAVRSRGARQKRKLQSAERARSWLYRRRGRAQPLLDWRGRLLNVAWSRLT